MRAIKDAEAKLTGADALALAKDASTVVVARGATIVRFSMTTDPPDDDTLLSHMLGRSGTLRAPTIRQGKTLLVGFNEDAYRELL